MIEDKGGEAARDAIELLQIFSFFHHDGISEEISEEIFDLNKIKSITEIYTLSLLRPFLNLQSLKNL
jgi:hypothetical protein